MKSAARATLEKLAALMDRVGEVDEARRLRELQDHALPIGDGGRVARSARGESSPPAEKKSRAKTRARKAEGSPAVPQETGEKASSFTQVPSPSRGGAQR